MFLLRYYRPICVTRRILVTDRMSVCSAVPCPNVPPFRVRMFHRSMSARSNFPCPYVSPFHIRMFHRSIPVCSIVPCPNVPPFRVPSAARSTDLLGRRYYGTNLAQNSTMARIQQLGNVVSPHVDLFVSTEQRVKRRCLTGFVRFSSFFCLLFFSSSSFTIKFITVLLCNISLTISSCNIVI